MASGFRTLYLHVALEQFQGPRDLGFRQQTMRGPARGIANAPAPEFASDEAAARFYLNEALDQDDRAEVRGLTSPDRPQVVPDFRLRHAPDTSLLTRGVRSVYF